MARELGEKDEATVRDRTIEAEKHRTERKAIYLDKPPDLGQPAKTKKKKDAARRLGTSSASKPSASSTPSYTGPPKASPLPSSSATRAAPAASSRDASSSKASPLPPPPSRASLQPIDTSSTRARLIHCIAVKPRTGKEVLSLCGGKDSSPETRSELKTLLNLVSGATPALLSSRNSPRI